MAKERSFVMMGQIGPFNQTPISKSACLKKTENVQYYLE
jgi:hypothetical protein